ncbi:MAG TPA: hypothetical protein VFP72_01880 [Kineosporiaceae bacterium]|nr:hypothetical protein [Kineosporiaceae bacterium]
MSSVTVGSALFRRWKISLAGLVLIAIAGALIMSLVPAQRQLTADVLLLPPEAGAKTDSNPYLQLDGLVNMTGIVARAVSSSDIQDSLKAGGLNGSYKVEPDTATPGPVLLVTVQAASQAEAGRTLDAVLSQIPTQLTSLQRQVGVTGNAYITSTVIKQDRVGTVVVTSQLRIVVGVCGGLFVLLILTVVLMDLSALRRQRRARAGGEQFGMVGGQLAGMPLATPDLPAPVTPAAPVAPPDPATRIGELSRLSTLSAFPVVPAAPGASAPAPPRGVPVAANGTGQTNGSAQPAPRERGVMAAELTPPAGAQSAGLLRSDVPASGASLNKPFPWTPGQSLPAHQGTAEPASPTAAEASSAPTVPFGTAVQPGAAGASEAGAQSGEEPSDRGGRGMSRRKEKDKGKNPAPSDDPGPPTGSFERLVLGKRNTPPPDPDPRAAAHRLN